MNIVFDLETDGLIDSVTKIWCATFYNIDLDSYVSYTPEDMEYLPEFLNGLIESGSTFICHNLLLFDREVFRKLYDIVIPLELCQDSFIWSQMLYPDIAPIGASKHGLDAWGQRFGIPKPKHEDWSQFSPEMLHRNIEDVKINTKLWFKIVKDAGIQCIT